jgi:dCMP deaminase
MPRASWHEYFMKIAEEVSTRATCDRLKVGAVTSRTPHPDHRLQRFPAGTPHCDEAGHLLKDGHCIRTIHAEANAVLQAAASASSWPARSATSPIKPASIA